MAPWSTPTKLARRSTSSRTRLNLQPLEGRNMPAAGGGYTAGGILGQYFANPDLSGTPAFSRRDVRIDFDWQGRAPGGSISPEYAAVPATDFSVRWTGQVIPKFSEWYTFYATGNNGIRLWIRPSGNQFSWTLLVDDWTTPTGAEDSAKYWMAGSQPYDVKVEYRELDGSAVARLAWSSPDTPKEVIDPALSLGVNAETYDQFAYADAAKTARVGWGDPVNYFGAPAVATDSLGWPTADAGVLLWDSRDPSTTGGTYLLEFQGQAQVTGWMGRGQFVVDGTNYGNTLPLDAGYDPTTNTTTAQIVLDGTDLFGLNFVQTQRTSADPVDSGITDLQVMRPTVTGGTTSYPAGELFDANLKQGFSRFTTLRYLTANFNPEQDWSDRKLPGAMHAAWGDQAAVWENEVMLANETGKDLYITIPVKATADYITDLANLLKYGSDGVNPYTQLTTDPVYPGLNPNLRVYVEWGAETWNWAFAQAGWAADADKDAVLSGTPEGQIINFDGQRPAGDFRRWAALKTVESSDTFRSVWGDAAMGSQVRILYEYQYDNEQFTATEGLRFIDRYFNNGDGTQHVATPHPVSYYIWGAGGASYFGSSNARGIVSNITVPGGTFETVRVGAGGTAVKDPTGTPWTYTGDAGVYRDTAGTAANAAMNVPGVGSVPATPQGAQAMYISGTGTASVTISFPKAGTYAVDFQAASKLAANAGNTLDFYIADQRITPNGRDPLPPPYPWWPGNGDRNSAIFSAYGTVPIRIIAPGRYTFQIVGRGTADQTTVIDNVQIESLDAIFASRIPAGARSAGEQSNLDYRNQLAIEAGYTQAYGLNFVAYEGGWSLGGDSEPVPLQSWAKYYDPRAATVMAAAINAFNQVGGALQVLGTYDLWPQNDAAHAGGYPLVQGIDSRLSVLPAAPIASLVVRGTTTLALKTTTATSGLSLPNGFSAPGDWLSWTVQVSTAGNYKVTTTTAPTGPVAIYVDGAPLVQGSGAATGVISLSAGVHTIRVQSVGGWFAIKGATIGWTTDPLTP
jgi:hypothetical protein